MRREDEDGGRGGRMRREDEDGGREGGRKMGENRKKCRRGIKEKRLGRKEKAEERRRKRMKEEGGGDLRNNEGNCEAPDPSDLLDLNRRRYGSQQVLQNTRRQLS